MAGQHARDAFFQLSRLEGLHDVVRRAQVHPRLDVGGEAEGGREDDRDVLGLRVRLEARAHLPPLHLGHHDVEQDEVGELCLSDGEPLLAPLRDQRLVAPALEAARDHGEDVLHVVHNEDARLPDRGWRRWRDHRAPPRRRALTIRSASSQSSTSCPGTPPRRSNSSYATCATSPCETAGDAACAVCATLRSTRTLLAISPLLVLRAHARPTLRMLATARSTG